MGKSSLLPPWVLQVFGMAIIGVFVVVRIETGQESTYLVGVGVVLAIGGTAQSAWERFKRELYKGLPHEEEQKGPPS